MQVDRVKGEDVLTPQERGEVRQLSCRERVPGWQGVTLRILVALPTLRQARLLWGFISYHVYNPSRSSSKLSICISSHHLPQFRGSAINRWPFSMRSLLLCLFSDAVSVLQSDAKFDALFVNPRTRTSEDVEIVLLVYVQNFKLHSQTGQCPPMSTVQASTRAVRGLSMHFATAHRHSTRHEIVAMQRKNRARQPWNAETCSAVRARTSGSGNAAWAMSVHQGSLLQERWRLLWNHTLGFKPSLVCPCTAQELRRGPQLSTVCFSAWRKCGEIFPSGRMKSKTT